MSTNSRRRFCNKRLVTDIDAIRTMLHGCDYEPIGDYAVIGDCRSAALVSRSGSIDWLCLPHFSAPSIFAALLDRRQGGRFLVRPRAVARVERRYLGRSAVLETTFHCAAGVAKLTDFMPLPVADGSPHHLVRLVECVQGSITVDIAWQPRPNYARNKPRIESAGDSAWHCRQGGGDAHLHSDRALSLVGGEAMVAGTWRLDAGQQGGLTFAYGEGAERPSVEASRAAQLKATLHWWQSWYSQWIYRGPWPDAVMRSCLTLKLLAYRNSGAVMAAATTSLPESMAAERNWDYRYCWLRDTSLLLQSFIDLGFEQESEAFLAWLLKVGCKQRLQPVYDLNGRSVPPETSLTNLEGYRGRGPVRIGNAAHQQLQLDIYGEIMQTAYRYVARGGQLSAPEKQLLLKLGESVCRLWRRPDQSIWETRSPPRHYTYSKLMCWVALDRLIALQQTIPLGLKASALRRERDEIRRAIDAQGFNRDLRSYVAYFGGSEPDASLLLMLRYGYLDHSDPRLRHTYGYIVDKLSVDGFLYRYPPGKDYDGVEGEENLFAVCSFWAVDYLARSGDIDQAQRLFERLLTLANDVGLYAEQFDTASRQPMGNFPQAFTHSGLVTAALAVEQAMQGKRGHQVPA